MGFERPRLRAGVFMTAAAALVAAVPAPAADFYAGRTVDFLIGGEVGGGYDIYARAIARHLHRFIPGNPTIVPKNMQGAGSARAASYLYSVVAKDGSVIGAVFPGAVVGPLLDDRGPSLFDPTKFQYLGSADNATRVCITHGRSSIKSFEDALKQKTIMGATAARGSTRDYATMHKKSTGVLFEMVGGYKGTADIFLAMERGEVDGMCGLDWASLKSQRPDWVRDRTVHILTQANLEPDAELLRLGVPQIWKYIPGTDDRKAVELIVGQQVFGRPYLAPPGVPAEAVSILRAAFAATMQDRDFLADAERTHIDVVPSTGERVQQLVEQLYATPKATVERAKDLLKP